MNDRFYVTTPIYYVNSSPHIGTAYTTIAADALARYHAMRGRRTWFLTGTDEHGQKIEREAQQRGVSPQAFVDEVSQRFRDLWPKLLVRPDDFIRTTQPRHEARVQAWWKRCADAGDIYLGEYEGWYCVADEAYYTEKELVDGKAPSGRPVERVREQSYFFRLSKYADALIELYESEPQRVMPEGRRNEVLSFLREGLRDLSLSRTTFTWGIPVPGDPKHVMYVWFDALFNYLTALEDKGLEGQFWPPDVQLVGKDILRFHAVYWPAFLLSAGLPPEQLPRTIWSHGFLLNGGRKVSKTRVEGEDEGPRQRFTPGTTDPTRLVDSLGADVLRYHLLREVAFGQDGDFNVPSIVSRARSDLAETVGNLLNRTLPFVVKHFDGGIPLTASRRRATSARPARCGRAPRSARDGGRGLGQPAVPRGPRRRGGPRPRGQQVLRRERAVEAREGRRHRAPRGGHLQRAGAAAAGRGDALARGAREERRDPRAARARRAHPAAGRGPLAARVGRPRRAHRGGARRAGVPEVRRGARGADLPRPRRGRPRRGARQGDGEEARGDEDRREEAATGPKPDEAGAVAPIEYADFERSTCAGQVLTAERIPKKDKLLKLSVDLGEATGPRTIIAGIALAYAPEALVGKQVTVVANLKPRSFGGGLTSHGMLLACGPSDGLSLATFEKEHAPGTRVK